MSSFRSFNVASVSRIPDNVLDHVLFFVARTVHPSLIQLFPRFDGVLPLLTSAVGDANIDTQLTRIARAPINDTSLWGIGYWPYDCFRLPLNPSQDRMTGPVKIGLESDVDEVASHVQSLADLWRQDQLDRSYDFDVMALAQVSPTLRHFVYARLTRCSPCYIQVRGIGEPDLQSIPVSDMTHPIVVSLFPTYVNHPAVNYERALAKRGAVILTAGACHLRLSTANAHRGELYLPAILNAFRHGDKLVHEYILELFRPFITPPIETLENSFGVFIRQCSLFDQDCPDESLISFAIINHIPLRPGCIQSAYIALVEFDWLTGFRTYEEGGREYFDSYPLIDTSELVDTYISSHLAREAGRSPTRIIEGDLISEQAPYLSFDPEHCDRIRRQCLVEICYVWPAASNPLYTV